MSKINLFLVQYTCDLNIYFQYYYVIIKFNNLNIIFVFLLKINILIKRHCIDLIKTHILLMQSLIQINFTIISNTMKSYYNYNYF